MMPCSFKKKFHKIGNENNLDSDKMAAPQMVDIRQLNPQQLTEVSQRMDQELAVLQGKHILEVRLISRVVPKFNGKGRKKNCFDRSRDFEKWLFSV